MNRIDRGIRIVATLTALFCLVCLAGCATLFPGHTVKQGEKVRTKYTCRLRTGEVVMTTDEKVAKNSSIIQSPFFMPLGTHREYEMASTLIAGSGAGNLYCSSGPQRILANEVMARLSEAVVGMKVKERKELEISSVVSADLPDKERYISLSYIDRGPIEVRYSLEELRKQLGKDPEIGDTVSEEEGFVFTVTALDGNEAVVRMSRPKGASLDTAFGPAIFHDKGDHYEIVTDVRVGGLVKTDILLGRIVDVDDQMFRIDYGHPFGGETLVCDVKVETSKPAGDRIAPGEANKASTETIAPLPDIITEGDLVEAHFTLRLEGGDVVKSSRMVSGHNPEERSETLSQPETFVAGKAGSVPGLGEALMGMKNGERKTLTLSPEEAFGAVKTERIERWPCTKRVPRVVTMSIADYVKRFGNEPSRGETLAYDPYLNVRIQEIDEKMVTMKVGPDTEKVVVDSLGKTRITPTGKEVILTLAPRIGAIFNYSDTQGRITETDGETFAVAFNDPLAGKGFVLDFEVVSFTRPSLVSGSEISWIEGHDKGLNFAKGKKPAVLVLYTNWCPWCRRLFDETLSDPRIKAFAERLVWIKVNTDKEKEIKALYEQKGVPAIVLIDAKGEVVKTIPGFKDARSLLAELNRLS